MAEVEQKKKRTFRKFTYRGVDLDQLLDTSYEELMQLYSARPAAEAALAAQAPEKGQKGGAAHGEARGGEDPPARHDHPARDGGEHGGRVQRQDLQPGGDQAGDDRPPPGRVLHHLQACEARPAWHRCHPLLTLHPPQVAVANKDSCSVKKKKEKRKKKRNT
ncbi:40S ribosomal protein S15 [Microtus ochrogaster]|uniref:40S ribosomal protein S15 n=1 Tax=Microtus ochrogaster TaxID=79684 RepID=A0A8J6GJ46_MICOH|nr:40S ribosomal protein S15 [Microtus ochrogaster]